MSPPPSLPTHMPTSSIQSRYKDDEKLFVNGSETNEAVTGNGYNWTNKQHTGLSMNDNRLNSFDVHKLLGGNEALKYHQATAAAAAADAARIKQQHHVRFSDEKNFSD
ncbi:uncharacterized protein ACN427_014486 isoform 2-T2 [Glossina fuscipes fuscipes]